MDFGDRKLAFDLTEVEYRVLRHIRQNPGKSRTQLASTLNLSKSMLTKAVSNFDRLNIIAEERSTLDSRERGQPPVLLSLRGNAFHSIGVYTNRQICAVVRADLNGNILYSTLNKLPLENTVTAVVDDVAAAIDSSDIPLAGIGHAVPA